MATHNTHNPLTGDGVVNTHNPLTGDKTGPNPPPGTNPITGRTKDGEFGRNEQQYGASGPTGVTGNQTTNTHNPLTGNGVNNTHNPLTSDNTATGTNPVTGRVNDGEFGRNEQQYGAGGPTGITGNQTHNTHNPLTGNGVNNTHNPLTGDKTGPNPPAGTNPVTGRTTDGELGRHEQYPAGATAPGANGAGYTGNDTIHDSTRGAHTGTGTGLGTAAGATAGTTAGTTTGTGAHPTAQQTSGGGAKALIGKVEATLGNILHNPEMHAKGIQKQEDAAAAKAAKAEGAHHGTHGTHGTNATTADPTNIPAHGHRTAEENLAAEAGPAGAGAGAGQMLGGGGRAAI